MYGDVLKCDHLCKSSHKTETFYCTGYTMRADLLFWKVLFANPGELATVKE